MIEPTQEMATAYVRAAGAPGPGNIRAGLAAALAIAERDHGEAVRLLEYALHLRQHGERAPGGNETWAQFDRDAEAFLRGRSDGAS